MKNIYILVFAIWGAAGYAQLVTCRPKMCMVNYFQHDDNLPNANMAAVRSILPDILIDNTAHSYWGEQNGYTGCIPSYYTSLGIEVFSYIAGGWESTSPSSVNDLELNLARIDGIAIDGATGVFLDQVSHHPSDQQKQYIEAIYNQCIFHNLKLILNPGTSSFDPWLMLKCDYLMTDEHYTGTRPLSESEEPYAGRILVINQNVTSATDAAVTSLGARSNGFGYSYACYEYINLPTWLSEYTGLISNITAITPVITLQNGTLYSDNVNGNQWYNSGGIVEGATDQTFTPIAAGTYYCMVSYSNGCVTGNSNSITVSVLSISDVNRVKVTFYPNPAEDIITFNGLSSDTQIVIYDIQGKIILSTTINKYHSHVDLKNLQKGLYLIKATTDNYSLNSKFIKQ